MGLWFRVREPPLQKVPGLSLTSPNKAGKDSLTENLEMNGLTMKAAEFFASGSRIGGGASLS